MNQFKTILLTLSLTFAASITFGCSCNWAGNFIHSASNYGELVIKARVIDRTYHSENGAKFKDLEKGIKKHLEENNYDVTLKFGESITIELLQVIKGTEKRKTIEIFGSDGVDCRASVRQFKVGEIYIFSLYRTGEDQNSPNEQADDYAMNGCAENWIKYQSNSDEVIGKIKGKSIKRKNRKYSYSKLV